MSETIWPDVSVLTPTFCRVALLEEAIESFLRQDYPGSLDMVVVNTFARQTLCFPHPRVRVINLPERPPLGEVRNLLVRLAKSDLLINLDDDDLMRPHYVRMCVTALQQHKLEWGQIGRMFYTRDRKIERLSNPSGNQMIFTRGAWSVSGGYPALSTTEDAGFHRRLTDSGCAGGFIQQPANQTGHIFGWGDHAGLILHASEGHAGDNPIASGAHADRVIHSGAAPEGEIVLKPGWKSDYEQACLAWLENHPDA